MKSEGRLLVGRWQGVNPWTNAEGKPINGGMKLCVLVRASSGYEFNQYMSFFEVDRDTGEPTPFAQQLRRANVPVGAKVAVRFTTEAQMRKGSAYANDTPVSIEVLEDAEFVAGAAASEAAGG